MSVDFLTQMARSSRERIERARTLCPEPLLREQAAATPLPPPLRLSPLGFDLIAEVKLRSPALGTLSAVADGDVEAPSARACAPMLRAVQPRSRC